MLSLKNDTCEKSDNLTTDNASDIERRLSDSDKKTAENFGIDYMDVSESIAEFGKEKTVD